MTQSQVKYHVEIGPVREVSLLGTADLSFWQAHLRAEDLQPVEHQGRAQVMIAGVDARFKGIAFKELSISILAKGLDDRSPCSGAFLVQAFNSIKFFAFVERTFFSTPYLPAQLELDAAVPAHFQVSQQGTVVLRAEMVTAAGQQRAAARDAQDGWQGPIYLPSAANTATDRRRLFFGKLVGQTQTYPFIANDIVSIQPTPRLPILGWLVESHFAGSEWQIRTSATHGKSKTIRRNALSRLFPAAANCAD